MEEALCQVMHQREEALTESLYEEEAEDVQKPTDRLLFVTPQFLETTGTNYESQQVALIVSEISAAAEFQMHDKHTEDYVKVGLAEHAAIDDMDKETQEVQQEMFLQEKQTVEMVEKVREECKENMSMTLPQDMTLKTDQLRNQEEQRASTAVSRDIEDLLTLQISPETCSEKEYTVISTVTLQSRYNASLLHFDEEINFVIPMAACAEETACEDRMDIDIGEKLDACVETDSRKFVTQAEHETSMKLEPQVREKAQPGDQFDVAISTFKPDIGLSGNVELPDEIMSEEIESCKPQLYMEQQEVKQQLIKLTATEQFLKEVEDASFKQANEQEVKAEETDHSREEITATDYLSKTGISETEIQEETTHVVQCIETIYDETPTEVKTMSTRYMNVLSYPVTGDEVEYFRCVEVMQPELVVECNAEVNEEAKHMALHVGNERIGSTAFEMMLPLRADRSASVVSDVENIIRAEEDETQTKLRGDIQLEAAGDVREDADEVCITMSSVRKETVEELFKEFQLPTETLAHLDDERDIKMVHYDAVRNEEVGFLLITPQIIELEADILSDIETEKVEQVTETLRPTIREREFTTNSSTRSVSRQEEIEIYMKKGTEYIELTTASASEEATFEKMLRATTRKENETIKLAMEEATVTTVVFPATTEQEFDLLIVQDASDLHEVARMESDERAVRPSCSEKEIIAEVSEVGVADGQKKNESRVVPVVAEGSTSTTQLVEFRSETESILPAAATSELPATEKQQMFTKDVRWLCLEIQDAKTEITAFSDAEATETMPPDDNSFHETIGASESKVTMKFVCEYEPTETELREIVFPTLSTDDSTNEAAVRVDATHAMFDNETMQFHETLKPLSQTERTIQNMHIVMDVTHPFCEDVQRQLLVPYSSPLIVHSGDTCAQTDGVGSESVNNECLVDLIHITEVHASKQNELTLSLKEELLCDSVTTVVFPENVDNKLLGDQASSSVTESDAVDLSKRSYLFDSSLPTAAEEDEVQKNNVAKQLSFHLQNNATSDSTFIQLRLSDRGDMQIIRPEMSGFADTISPEEQGTEDACIEDDILKESINEECLKYSPPQAVGDADVCQLTTGIQDSEFLPHTVVVGGECSYLGEEWTGVDLYRECSGQDESETTVQLFTMQMSLCDGTLVHSIGDVEVCDTYDHEEDIRTAVDTSHTEEAVKAVTSVQLDDNVHTDGGFDASLPILEEIQTVDTTQAPGSDLLELACMERTTSSLLEFLDDVQTQQLETFILTETFSDHTDRSYVETSGMESEREMKKETASYETNRPTEVDREESKTSKVCESVVVKPPLCELKIEDVQYFEPDSVKSEQTCTAVPKIEGSPWSLLFADLFGDDSSKPVTVSVDVSKEDEKVQSVEASDVEREKMEHQAVSDEKLADSSTASNSSVVTRKVQKVSADGRVVERVKSEEVPMSFGPASLAPYFTGCDLPSPPDFSPQSDDHQPSPGSIKVYTDTVEGEPWTERRTQEVTETQPDGTKITRKVVRVRKRRTIIKHIVIEGPEFEEIVLDEPEKPASTAEALSTKPIEEVPNVEGDFQPRVCEQPALFASECKVTPPKSDTGLAPALLSVERDMAVRKNDLSCTELEADETQSVEYLCSSIKVESDEPTTDSGDKAHKDSPSTPLPHHESPPEMPVSTELQPNLFGETRRYGESEYLLLDVDRDIGDVHWLDSEESASSCGDFATGILRYSHV